MASIRPSVNDSIVQQTILDAFREKLIDNLVADAIAGIKPKLYAAARQAVKELEPGLQAYMEPMSQQVIVNLIVKGKES